MDFLRWSTVVLGISLVALFGVGIGVSGAVGDSPDTPERIALQDPDVAPVDEALANESGEVQVLVEFEQPRERVEVGALKAQASETRSTFERFADRTAGVSVENTFWITNAAVVTVHTDQVPVASLAEVSGVTRIQEPLTVEVDSGATPVRDVGSGPFSSALGPDATASSADATYGLEQIGAPAAWSEYDARGEGIRVAVLDTGVDAEHSDIDLVDGGWAEFDVYGDPIESEPYDGNGHGTHASGTVAGGNASGTHIGVAPEAELYHGKVMDENGEATFPQVIAGMEWAIENDVDVISMSLGAEGYYSEFINPIRNAENAGVTVVTSSGNEGEGTSNSPGNVYDALAVGATGEAEDVTDFSSGERIDTDSVWGSAAPSDWPEKYVVPTVAAPGSLIDSAKPGGGYQKMSGTSMAAPHVAGAVALVQAATGERHSPDDLTDALTETAWTPDSWDGPDDPDTRYGAGIVDVPGAIESLGGEANISVTSASVDNATVLAGESVAVKATLENSGDADGSYTTQLVVDGEVVDLDEVVLGAGETETVTFNRTFEERGTYELAVNDVTAGTLTVEQPATFTVRNATVEPAEILVNESAEITATVENDGDRNGTYTAGLQVDGEAVETNELPVEAGENATVTFERAFAEAGEYALAVNGTDAETLTVERPITTEVANVTVEPRTVSKDDSVTANASITNVGDRSGSTVVEFAVETEPVANRSVTLDASESTNVSFGYTFEQAGGYNLTVDGTDAGAVTVNESEKSLDEYRDADGVVSIGQLRTAISDWRAGDIELGLLREVITAWRQG